MSDFTIEQSQPQYNPWSPLSAMGQLATQNVGVEQGQIANQGSLLNLQLQAARQKPVISMLQNLQSEEQGQGGGATSLAPAATNTGPLGTSAGGSSGVSATPLAAPGAPQSMLQNASYTSGGGGGDPSTSPGNQPSGPPPGTPSGGNADGTAALPPGPGDFSQQLYGVALPPMLASQPNADFGKLNDTRSQWLETGARQASTPQAWNSFIMSAYNGGWISSSGANKMLNNFGQRQNVLDSYASPDEQLKYTGETQGQGMMIGSDGQPVVDPNVVQAKEALAYGQKAGEIGAATAGNPGLIQAETGPKAAQAGAVATATQVANAPYAPPVTIQVPDGKGGYTTQQVPLTDYARTLGAGGTPGALGATGAPAPESLTPSSGPNPTNPLYIRPQGSSTGFMTYSSPQAGVLAASDNLQAYAKDGINTVQGVISKWAPSNENNTAAYIQAVTSATGYGANQKIDLNDPNVRYKLHTAMSQQESRGGRAAVNGLGGQPAVAQAGGNAPLAAATATPPTSPTATGVPAAGPGNPNLKFGVAGPPLSASNTGSNVGIIPYGIAPGPGQVNAPPVVQPAAAVSGPAPVANPAALGQTYQPAVGPVSAPAAAPLAVPPVASLNVPAPQAAPGSTPIVPGAIVGGTTYGPAEKAEQDTIGQAYGDQAEGVVKAAQQAPITLGKIEELRNAANQAFRPGATGDERLALAKTVTDVFQSAGLPAPQWATDATTGGETIQKIGGGIAADLTRAMGSREAASVFNSIKGITPNITMSQGGFGVVLNSMQQGAQRDQDLGSFQDQWLAPGSGHSSTAGMMTQFNKDYPIEAYSSRVVPFPYPTSASQAEKGVIYRNQHGQSLMWDGTSMQPVSGGQ